MKDDTFQHQIKYCICDTQLFSMYLLYSEIGLKSENLNFVDESWENVNVETDYRFVCVFFSLQKTIRKKVGMESLRKHQLFGCKQLK